MRKMVAAGIIVLALTAAANAALIIHVQPDGDGHSGRARYGFSYGWENTGFNVNASPNWAGHWYESSWASGESSNVFMQIALASIPADAVIQSAELYLYITECSGSGGQINHRTHSATATGQASQQLAGDVKIDDINVSPGWLNIDVTSYIQSDLDKGHDWAVFSFPSKSYSSLKFSSAETEHGAYLSVVIPEPATLMILGFGALTLLRRKTR